MNHDSEPCTCPKAEEDVWNALAVPLILLRTETLPAQTAYAITSLLLLYYVPGCRSPSPNQAMRNSGADSIRASYRRPSDKSPCLACW